MNKFYSNSFGKTVTEIAENKVSIEEIIFVISGTAIVNRNQIREAYSPTWGEKEIQIAERLFDEGKVIQPRLILEGENSPFNPFGNNGLITYGKEVFYTDLNELCEIEIDDKATAHNLWVVNRLREKDYLPHKT